MDNYIKATLIKHALEKKHQITLGTPIPTFNVYQLINELTMIIDDLTSPIKFDREFAKKEIRELVKLGKEA